MKIDRLWTALALPLSLQLFGFVPTPAWSMGTKLQHGKPVQWEENKTWELIVPHWAITYDQDNQPLAIYDLSYPDLNQRVELGVLDLSMTNYQQLIQLLRNSATTSSQMQTRTTAKPELQSAISALTELSQKTQQRITAQGQQNSPLPNDWWKSVPWKTSPTEVSEHRPNTASDTLLTSTATSYVDLKGAEAFSQQATPPRVFTLENIDFEKLSTNYTEFKRLFLKISQSLNFLREFEFVRTAHGGYHLYWNPETSGNEETPAISPPYKLADLRCPECSLEEGFTEEVLLTALSQLLILIPNPVIAGLIGTALGEWIHLRVELVKMHQDALLEMIQTANETTWRSTPWSHLSPLLRSQAISGLIYAGSHLWGSWALLLQTPVDQWKTQEINALAQAHQATRTLEKQGKTLSSLGPRFAISASENQKQIFALASRRYWTPESPTIALDYQNPDTIRLQRNGIENANLLVHFAVSMIPTPLVGVLLCELFERLVHSPMHSEQHWDSRLNAQLQWLQARGENWEQEMTWIQKQSTHPFAASWEQIRDAVQLRSTLLPAKQNRPQE